MKLFFFTLCTFTRKKKIKDSGIKCIYSITFLIRFKAEKDYTVLSFFRQQYEKSFRGIKIKTKIPKKTDDNTTIKIRNKIVIYRHTLTIRFFLKWRYI